MTVQLFTDLSLLFVYSHVVSQVLLKGVNRDVLSKDSIGISIIMVMKTDGNERCRKPPPLQTSQAWIYAGSHSYFVSFFIIIYIIIFIELFHMWFPKCFEQK